MRIFFVFTVGIIVAIALLGLLFLGVDAFLKFKRKERNNKEQE